MKSSVSIEMVLKISGDVVAREIQGEFIIIPITSGIGDLEEEIFSLNDSAKEIWNRLDGKSTLKEIAKDVSKSYDGTAVEIEKDVLGLTKELLKRRMLVEVK